MDSALVAMAMMQGLTSAIVNPNDLRLMETIKSCDIFKNNELYSDSYLDALICQFTVPCCEIPAGESCIPLKKQNPTRSEEVFMSVLTDLIYGGSHAVAGLTEGAVNDAIAKYGADHPIAFPDTAYFFPTIYAATGVKVRRWATCLPAWAFSRASSPTRRIWARR